MQNNSIKPRMKRNFYLLAGFANREHNNQKTRKIMKNSVKYTVMALGLLSVAACTAAPRTLPPGEYKKTERSVDAAGTEYKKETTTDVYYDEYGNKRATQETQTSKDPKGLMNKSTSTTKKTY